MEITYLGHASFKIRGKNVTVVTDPFRKESVGFSFPKLEADMVTVSHEHQDHNAVEEVGGNPFVILGPGEYEVKEVMVIGVSCFHDAAEGSQRGKNTAYVIQMENLSLCHLGDLGHKLTAGQLEELNGVDLLFVPVGGVYTLGPEEAVSVVAQIEPKVVIPMHYKTEGMNPLFKNLSQVSDFLKAAGEEEASPWPKLVIGSEKLPEERQIVVLERRG